LRSPEARFPAKTPVHDLETNKAMSVPSAISFPVNSGTTQQPGTRR
jgi:hypothetical protein